MISSVFILLIWLVPVAGAFYVAGKREGIKLALLVGAFGGLFLVSLAIINVSVPFSGAGDDADYFKASSVVFKSLGDWFDLRQFNWTHEQTGYPLILAWVHQFSGGSLYHRKALNVFFMLMLALVWYAIGNVAGGRRLAMLNAVGIMLTTPLWFYWIFLLKDMTIVFLQSLFLLGVVLFLNRASRYSGYALIIGSTLLLLPFRSLLVLVNLAALALAITFRTEVRRSAFGSAGKMLLAGSIAAVILFVATNGSLMQSFGVTREQRVVSVEAVTNTIVARSGARSEYFYNPPKFVLVYMMGEVAAFNPNSWGAMSPTMLRSLSMVPWIYFGIPMFIVGMREAFRRRRSLTQFRAQPQLSLSCGGTAVASQTNKYIMLFIMFAVIYAGVAWLSGDTTRWRMAAMPPMIAIAVYGWQSMKSSRRIGILLGWFLLLSVALIFYYALIH